MYSPEAQEIQAIRHNTKTNKETNKQAKNKKK